MTLEQLITQTCTGNGVINEKHGPYLTGKMYGTSDSIYLTAEEAELLTRFRNAEKDERHIIRKILGM